MKKFLTVLLVIAVMFTFSFGTAMAAPYAAPYSDDDTTALLTAAQQSLQTAKDNLDDVKDYYVRNYTDGTIRNGVPITKDALKIVVDEAFDKMYQDIVAVYKTQVEDINAGTLSGATLKERTDEVKAAINAEYVKYDTAKEVTAFIKGDSDLMDALLEAQFDIAKADALATLDKVNFGNYSTTLPDEPSYDTNKYYSNQKIAQTIVDNAKKDINAIKFDKSEAAQDIKKDIPNIVKKAVVEDADTEGLYYVIADTKTLPIAIEKGGLVKRAATEAKEEKTLAEEKAYQISVVNGKISLAEAKIRKELNTLLEDTKLDKETKKLYEDALADLTKYVDACKEVAAAQINYAETNQAAIDAGKAWTDECDTIIDATKPISKVDVKNYVATLDEVVAITEKVDEQEALAAKMKAETGFNGTPLYDAASIDDALAADIESLYTTGNLSATEGLSTVGPNEDLVKAEMLRVLTGSSDVTLNKVVYPVVADWMHETFEDDAKTAEADKIVRETIDAIRAAKTVEDVDAAFVAGYEKFKAVPTAEDYYDFWYEEATEEAVAKYGVKLMAALVEKAADYGVDKFNKDYPIEGNGEAFISNLVGEYLAGSYTMDELAAGYEKALAEIKNLKTKAELEAEQKAINDAILAIKAPVKEADEATVLALAKRVEDFYDYQKLIGLYENKSYAYIVYDSLLGQYVDTLVDLVKEKLEDAAEAIEKGGITVEDEAAIAELEKMLKDAAEKYGAFIRLPEELIDAAVAFAMADYKADLVDAKADEVEAAIAKIDASAKPLDTAAIKAAREAYDALGEVGINRTMYHKLLSLENLAKAESIAAVESLKIKASSSAKKGSITVKWTVKGDKAAADGYQIWKSTKKNSGFKKAFTTSKTSYKNTKGLKKGTRYYYKVRAYVVVEGKTYYSDWSNKAYRVAK